METSEKLEELAKALSKAQSSITGAHKTSDNPYFKSKYADLAECISASREALVENGLCVVQTTRVDGELGKMYLDTMLLHESGQWIRGATPVAPEKMNPQAMGSCITYARRYAYAAIVGLAQVDDDGDSAAGATHATSKGDIPAANDQPNPPPAAKSATKAELEEAKAMLAAVSEGGIKKLQAAWATLPLEVKRKLGSSKWWTDTKEVATAVDNREAEQPLLEGSE